ncbi:MAG: hypothetical protein NTY53_21770, partial [Kiritimatiellaeota bacterium]|nr:hypothetical protein [Kiritimatiellota bacterium]
MSATASSELPVSFSVVDGPGVWNGTNLTFNGVGPVSIVATQAGDGQWAAATPVTITINVAPYPTWQKPDFVVDSITTIPASPALGGTFTAKVIIRNGGFVRGTACTVKVWANHPATAISNEVADASQIAGTLGIGETNVLYITGLTVPSVPGTFTLRAFVDGNDRTPESSEGNNQTTLTYYPAMPDFVVTALAISPTPLTNGNTFAATVTIKNQGTVSGNAGLLRIWLSHGATALTNEPGDAVQTAGTLAAGESKDIVFSGLTATNKAGSYYLRAFVDANNATYEVNDGNNQNTLSYTVAAAGSGGGGGTGSPDFTVTAISIAPTALTNGNTFAATVTVKNQGAVAADAGLLRIWLSHGATAVTNEPGDATQTVGTLAAGASTSLNFTNLTAPALA